MHRISFSLVPIAYLLTLRGKLKIENSIYAPLFSVKLIKMKSLAEGILEVCNSNLEKAI
jgi:hypothetical protein